MTRRILRTILLPTLLLLCSAAFAQTKAPAPASSSSAPQTNNLIVGVKVAPPFVIEKNDKYSGLAIDLWQEAAADHGWKYGYKQYDLDGLLNAVQHDDVDVGLGAITATADREKRMDFTHTITSSGLGVAVRNQGGSGWLAVIQALASAAFLKVIGTLAVLLLIVGVLAWAFEHKRNPEQFGGSKSAGIFSGFWWAMVTMTTSATAIPRRAAYRGASWA